MILRNPSEKVPSKEYQLKDFKFIKLLGIGSNGKVYLVQHFKNKELMAIKSIRKDVIIENDQVQAIYLEKLIMDHIDHPFIIKVVSIFVTSQRIYLLMHLARGRDLLHYLKSERRL